MLENNQHTATDSYNAETLSWQTPCAPRSLSFIAQCTLDLRQLPPARLVPSLAPVFLW